ncbi:HlyD family secretion protein [Silvimonas sp.]|uniref:HlyD family secretion protein n=1 Tax=Silvimonas sp. TaxID=2650811 RepID=UPI00283E83DD|nr:HlyD family secretion protein [Silvimonas sp.]MDR3428679.1 HlyD family secretion protein [Silvimonas sp.]
MMSDSSPSQDTAPAAPAPPVIEVAKPGRAARLAPLLLLLLIILSLLWYFAADRITPYSSQARVQAFVIPVAPEVAGIVKKVLVKDNDDVQKNQPLFEIDPVEYQIALDRAKSDYESARKGVSAAAAGVDSAKASLRAAQANQLQAEQDAHRQETLYAEDPGAISVRRLETAQAAREQARAKTVAAAAEVVRAQESMGGEESVNAKIASARSAVAKAELDMKQTTVFAPSRGLVTDLRADVGQFAQAGAATMTLIAIHDLWISAEMTENNLGNVKVGDAVGIVLDVMPGEVLKGRVRSIGNGVSSGKSTPAGSLPTIENNRDWLRQAQRFPVAIEFLPEELKRIHGMRVGGQADVMIFTGERGLLSGLGSIYLSLMSKLSYVY